MSETERVLDDLVRALRVAHGCHTVVLYGSHARGAEDSTSDLDVLGVTASGTPKRLLKVAEGIVIDAFVEPESALEVLTESALRFEHGRVLWEEDDYGTRLLERVAALAAEGPPRLEAEADRSARLWLYRTLRRTKQSYDDDDDLASLQRRALLQSELLTEYFRLRERWYRGVKLSVAWLATHDPPVYQRIARALRHEASYDDLEQAVDAVLALPEPKLPHHAVLRTIDAVRGDDDANRFRKTMRRAFEQGRVERLPEAPRDDLLGTFRAKVRAADQYGAEIPGLRALSDALATTHHERVVVWRFQGSRTTCELYTDGSGAELIGWAIPV